jgi:NAD(P)H-dependent FMN reductase
MTTSAQLNIKVIAGSTREGRFSDKAAAWIAEEVEKQAGVAVEVLDLRDYPMPFFSEPMSPLMVKDGAYSNEIVRKWASKLREADAFIIVTPEYNHSTSGVLKNALDWVYYEWNKKPVTFVSYGSAGGARAVEQLRLIAAELQMAPMGMAVHIPGERYFPVMFGKASADDLFASMSQQAEATITQLLWWAHALKNARG